MRNLKSTVGLTASILAVIGMLAVGFSAFDLIPYKLNAIEKETIEIRGILESRDDLPYRMNQAEKGIKDLNDRGDEFQEALMEQSMIMIRIDENVKHLKEGIDELGE